MKALVTGAAGFIGSHLAEALLDRGAEVTGLDCFADYYPRPIKERNLLASRQRGNFTFVESTIQSADLPALLRGVTHVFHLAAQAGVRKSWGRDFRTYTVNNIEATQILLEACAAAPLDPCLRISSSVGDDVALPMRDSCASVSPSCRSCRRAPLHLYRQPWRAGGLATSLSTARASSDMVSHSSRRRRGTPSRCSRASRPGLHQPSDAVSATVAAAEKGVPGRHAYWRQGARVGEPRH
jgi:UDP-glucose 4-epimerase